MQMTAELKARIKTPAQIVEKMQRDLNRFYELSEKPFHRLSPLERKEFLKLRTRRACVKI